MPIFVVIFAAVLRSDGGFQLYPMPGESDLSDWDQIIRKNTPQVVNAAFRVIGDFAAAEDVAQDVFVEAFRKWTACTDHRWAGLLRRMAVRRAIDALRVRRSALERLTETPDRTLDTPERQVMYAELQQIIRRSVASLPDREGEVFCLVYYERMSHSEVASALSMSKSAVATALSRARAKLAKHMLSETT